MHNFKVLIRMQLSGYVPQAQCSAMQRTTQEALNKLVQVLKAILLCKHKDLPKVINPAEELGETSVLESYTYSAEQDYWKRTGYSVIFVELYINVCHRIMQ